MAVIHPQIDIMFRQERAFEKCGTQIRFFHLPSTDRILLIPRPKASLTDTILQEKEKAEITVCLRCKCLTPRRLSDTKKSFTCRSYLLQIVPELCTIPLSRSFSLLKNDILKTEHGTCFICTLDACIPDRYSFFNSDKFIRIVIINFLKITNVTIPCLTQA